MKIRCWSLGHIANSRCWVSIEHRYTYSGAYISLGKTYCGTKWGLVAQLGNFVLLAHIREATP